MNLEEFPKEYQRLIRQVRLISAEASAYLANEAPKTEYFAPAYYLIGSFIYEKTPQGHRYWEEIGAELQKQRAKYADLVQRIADLGVDQETIDYLNNGAMDLDSFCLTEDLYQAFWWFDTPQEEDFWKSIGEQLEEVKPGEVEIPPNEPEIMHFDMEAVQKRFFKLMEFKREHCPDTVFDPRVGSHEVYYDHIREQWGYYKVDALEKPTSVYFNEKTAKMLASQLNSGEFEL